MANIEHYRQCIQTILRENGKYKPKYDEIDNELIFDTIHDHYQLMYDGFITALFILISKITKSGFNKIQQKQI